VIFLKTINNNSAERLKDNILLNTKPLIPTLSDRRIGLYSKISGNFINIKDVNEIPTRSSPICIHFYGMILTCFRKRFLIGLFIPEILYTIFTLVIIFFLDEYFELKIIAAALWSFVLISNINRIKSIYKQIVQWLY